MPTVFPAYELTRTRSPDQRLNDVFNVKDFGAVGDNVKDDTIAIQAAINAANEAGGGRVEIPAGTYKVTGAIQFYTDTTIQGHGRGSVIQASINGPIFKAATGGTARTYRATIRDMLIDGTNKANYPLSSGVRLQDCSQCLVENVLVRNCGDGVDIYGSIATYYNTLLHVDAATCDIAFYIASTGNENRILACRAVDVGDGVRCADCSGLHVVSFSCETFTGVGVRIANLAGDTRIVGARFENAPSNGTGISTASTSFRTTIIGAAYIGLSANLTDLAADTFTYGYDAAKIGGGTDIKKHLSGTVNVDIANVPAASALDTLVAFTGAADGDTIILTPDKNTPANLCFMPIPYNGTNNFYIRTINPTAGAINPPALTFRVDIWKH